MAYPRFQFTATDRKGNIVPGAAVEVRNESNGSLATIYSDTTGTVLGNPFVADSDGYAFFHANAGEYKITTRGGGAYRVWRYVKITTAGISESIITAKGDLISGAAASTPVIVSVGVDGYSLKSDSTNSSGLSWKPTREVLSANRSYYVRTDGSDSNNGLSNTSGGAFLTIQKAVDTVAALDTSIYAATINVAAGTYTGSVVLKALTGGGSATILGDAATPTNCVISTSGACVTANGVKNWTVSGFKFASSANNAVSVGQLSQLTVSNFNLGAVAASAFVVSGGSTLRLTGSAAMSGNTGNYVLYATNNGIITTQSQTWTFSGTPTFSIFALSTVKGLLIAAGNTYTGAATGTKYLVNNLSFLQTNGALSSLPGTGGTIDASSFGVGT